MDMPRGYPVAMSAASVFPALEALLPRIQKPIQYVGGEVNAVVGDWDAAEVRWALMYPDAYEVGAPNQGVQILYEVLNEQPGVLCERTYAVWPDLEALMREHAVPGRRGGSRSSPHRHRAGLEARRAPGWTGRSPAADRIVGGGVRPVAL